MMSSNRTGRKVKQYRPQDYADPNISIGSLKPPSQDPPNPKPVVTDRWTTEFSVNYGRNSPFRSQTPPTMVVDCPPASYTLEPRYEPCPRPATPTPTAAKQQQQQPTPVRFSSQLPTSTQLQQSYSKSRPFFNYSYRYPYQTNYSDRYSPPRAPVSTKQQQPPISPQGSLRPTKSGTLPPQPPTRQREPVIESAPPTPAEPFTGDRELEALRTSSEQCYGALRSTLQIFSSFENSLNAYNATRTPQSFEVGVELPALQPFVRELERLRSMAYRVVSASADDNIGGGSSGQQQRSGQQPAGVPSLSVSSVRGYIQPRNIPAAGRIVAKGDTTGDCLHIYD